MFSGSIPALATPFRDGSFDEAAFRKLVDWQIDNGSKALVPCGTTGELLTTIAELVHDERAAAFYALGHARARSGSCACVVTTSGTAVANLLPAACEADRDGVSIIFATADRPAEMRGVGADQVLERQQDLLRSTLRRGADLPPADDRVAALGDLGEVSRPRTHRLRRSALRTLLPDAAPTPCPQADALGLR